MKIERMDLPWDGEIESIPSRKALTFTYRLILGVYAHEGKKNNKKKQHKTNEQKETTFSCQKKISEVLAASL